MHQLSSRNILGRDSRNAGVDLLGLSCQFRLAKHKFRCCCLHLQRGVHGSQRRSVCSVRGWNIQNRERQCVVYELWDGTLLFYGRGDGGGGLRLQRGVHRTERGTVRSVRGWDV